MKRLLLLILTVFSISSFASEKICRLQFQQCNLAFRANSSLLEFDYRDSSRNICQSQLHTCRATLLASEGNEEASIKACREIRLGCLDLVDANSNAFEFGYKRRTSKVCKVSEKLCLIAVEEKYGHK